MRESEAVDAFIEEVFKHGWERKACENGTPPEIVAAFWDLVVTRRRYRSKGLDRQAVLPSAPSADGNVA